jgi:hypothetical protein
MAVHGSEEGYRSIQRNRCHHVHILGFQASHDVANGTTNEEDFVATIPDFLNEFQVSWAGRNVTVQQAKESVTLLLQRPYHLLPASLTESNSDQSGFAGSKGESDRSYRATGLSQSHFRQPDIR